MGALSLALGLGLTTTPGKGGGVLPAGFDFVTYEGVRVTHLGLPVVTDGTNLFTLGVPA